MDWQDIAVAVVVAAAAFGLVRFVLGSLGLRRRAKGACGCAQCPANAAKPAPPSTRSTAP